MSLISMPTNLPGRSSSWQDSSHSQGCCGVFLCWNVWLFPKLADRKAKGIQPATDNRERKPNDGGGVAFDAINKPTADCVEGKGTTARQGLPGVGISADISHGGWREAHGGPRGVYMHLVTPDDAMSGEKLSRLAGLLLPAVNGGFDSMWLALQCAV